MPCTMPTAICKLMEYLPHPVIAPIIGIPTCNTLVDRIYQISYNMALMKMTLGGGKPGLLTFTVSLKVHNTLYNTTVEKTLKTSPAPNILPNSTRTNQTAIWYKFTTET